MLVELLRTWILSGLLLGGGGGTGGLALCCCCFAKPVEELDVMGEESEVYEGGAKLPEADGLV